MSVSDFPEYNPKRVRSNLRYLTNLQILDQKSNYYDISCSNNIQLFFDSIRKDQITAKNLLMNHLRRFEELNFILEKNLTYPSIISTTDLSKVLQELDNDQEKLSYYTQGSKFLAGMMHLLGLAEYSPLRRQIKRINGGIVNTKSVQNSLDKIKRERILLGNGIDKSDRLVIKYKGVDLSFTPKEKDKKIMREVLKLQEVLGER